MTTLKSAYQLSLGLDLFELELPRLHSGAIFVHPCGTCSVASCSRCAIRRFMNTFQSLPHLGPGRILRSNDCQPELSRVCEVEMIAALVGPTTMLFCWRS